jgi:hypothetical protein
MEKNIVRKKSASGARNRFRYNMLLTKKEIAMVKSLARKQQKSMAAIFIDGVNLLQERV